MRKGRFVSRRCAALLLLAALMLGLAAPAAAFHITELEAADTLNALGLFRGTENGYELDRSLTRQEAAVMFVRLLGCEDEAEEGHCSHPFSDVSAWADDSIGYAWENGLVMGVSENRLGASSPASIRDLLTYVLRALGYTEWVDFEWEHALEFARSIGLVGGEFESGTQPALRGDAVLIFYTALVFECGGETLIDRLYREGDVSYAQLVSTRLASHASYGRKKYTAAQIYERCASSVFFVEAYADEESFSADKAMGFSSGFFISPDGLALMSYHGLDEAEYARITMKDGLQYNIDSIISYDTQRDYALARISRTAVTGECCARFPYIPLGDTNALYEGETIYAIGNPLGISSMISSGIINGSSRELYEMPFIHFDAAVSSGSSGGALINEYGEAVGIVFGSYNLGQVMNLAVPVNCIDGVDTGISGKPLTEVCAEVKQLRETATIHVDYAGATLRIGETLDVTVTHNCPGGPGLRFDTTSRGVVEVAWGEYTNLNKITLHITALEVGDAEIVISFNDANCNQEAAAIININVTP